METEIWQRLPEELLDMILARLPIRVLGEKRTVCKQWNYLLSSPHVLQGIVPNWSLHSTPGFLIQIHWDWKDDVEYWIVEGSCSHIYKAPLLDRVIVDTCNGVICCRGKDDPRALSIGIPGTRNWRELPRPAVSFPTFTGMTIDLCTRRCTILLGRCYIGRIVMSIYDSQSNEWTEVSMMIPDHIHPFGKGVYCKGKFYWQDLSDRNFIIAFNITDGLWTEIPVPEACVTIFSESLSEYHGQVVIADRKEVDRVRVWKLKEAEKYELWREVPASGLTKGFLSFHKWTLNSGGLIMLVDWKLNMWILNHEGKIIVREMSLPGLSRSQEPYRVSVTGFESNNLWWPY